MINNIYTAPEQALDKLMQRKTDPRVLERVANYLGSDFPDNSVLDDAKQVAVLARYVSRATDEDRFFADFARSYGFEPYWAAYLADQYTTRNPEKVQTLRPPIRWQKAQKTRQWLVAPENRQGTMGQIPTLYGYSVADYQQGLRKLVFDRDGNSEIQQNTFDMSGWYQRQAPRFGYTTGDKLSLYYYCATMALATSFCVIFEDFDGGPNSINGDLASFTDNIVYPAINKIKTDLGLDPIIVRLPYREGFNETGLEFLGADAENSIKQLGVLSVLPGRIGL